MFFASDNWSGACNEVNSALALLGSAQAPAYSDDALTEKMNAELSRLFETEVSSLIVATGSAANALGLAAFAKPAGIALAHCSSHINIDEYNGPERVSPGLKILGLAGQKSKIGQAELDETLAAFPEGVARQGRLASLSITQATELGEVYTLAELKSLVDAVKTINLGAHMDGARFANAVAALNCSPAEMTWKLGFDCLSFGFTKNGAWCADLLVFFNQNPAIDTDYIRKQMGHNISKAQFVSAQVLAMLEGDTWLNNARHANAMAKRLAEGIASKRSGAVAVRQQTNAVFAQYDARTIDQLTAKGAKFYPWLTADFADGDIDEDKTLMRHVTSFATTEENVDAFVGAL